MIIVGIDLGLDGAFAHREAGHWHIKDLPTQPTLGGLVERQIDAGALYDALVNVNNGQGVVAVIERVHAMPKQGVSSSFSFGDTRGTVRGVCESLGFEVREVLPQMWKAHFQLLGQPKDAARQLAARMFPYIAEELKLKKHHNRGDAVLIGQWYADIAPGFIK